jgi:hypothetical protein
MNRLVLVAATAVAASLATSTVAQADPISDLAVARGKWENRDAQNYSYRVEYRAMIGHTPPTAVRVVKGKPRATPETLRRFDTVEELFTRVEEAITTAQSVQVAYAPNTGVPISLVVDSNVMTIDDEWSLKVTQIKAPKKH